MAVEDISGITVQFLTATFSNLAGTLRVFVRAAGEFWNTACSILAATSYYSVVYFDIYCFTILTPAPACLRSKLRIAHSHAFLFSRENMCPK